MDKSDVEMEDAEKLPRDFPEGVHQSETKTIGVQIEREKEKASDEAGDANGCENGTKTVGVHVESEKEKASEEAGDAKECENGTKTIALHVESEKEKAFDEAGDANECENGSDSSKKVGNEANDKPSVEIEMEDQVDPKAEVLDKSGNKAKDKSLVDIEMENQVDPKAKDSDKSGNEAEDKASVERQMEDQVNLKSEDSDTSGNGAKDKPSVESEMKDQVDPKAEDSDKSGNEAKDKPSVESEVKDQVEPKAKDSDKSGNEAKDKPSVESEMEDQVDPKAEDSDKPGKEAKDKPSVESEMEAQVDPKTEIGEPLNAAGLVGEIVNAESENEGGINTKNEADQQTGAKSAPEKQNNAKLEVFEQNATTDGVKEDTSAENGENPVKSITEETPGEDKEDEMPKELGSGDADSVDRVAMVEKTTENARGGNGPCENAQLPTDKSYDKALQSQNVPVDEVSCDEGKEMEIVTGINGETVVKDEPKEQVKELVVASPIADGNSTTVETSAKHKGDDSSYPNQYEAATPSSLVRYSPSEAGDHSEQRVMATFTQVTPFLVGEGDDGTPEDQAAFMKEIETFYRGRAMDFKPPKFYGQPLNCLKLWRAVIRLGGYDRVTGSKLWRQVGESFHPPKTCTTVSWTFRIFYEKSLLEYERHKRQSGELQLPPVTLPEVSVVDTEGNGYQGSGPGRARRDAAARAMQGWHAQRLFGDSEAAEQAIKDKNLNNMPKREKSLKSLGSLKQKRANDMENSVKVARTEAPKQLVPSVHDAGPPADWVKINIRQTKDTFEVYALVPGLLREEVRVQSDPQGRVVITGDPQQLDNPWGITKFQKVVNLHARIDPLQTSAVVSLHGRLLVTVPIEQSTNI